MFLGKVYFITYIVVVYVLWCEGTPSHTVPHCGLNEMFYNEPYCDPSCAARGGSPHALKDCSTGCRCKKGYVRDSYNITEIFPSGNCIEPNDCMIIA